VPQREGGLCPQRRHAARSHSVHIARPRTARDAQAKLRRDVRFGRRVRDTALTCAPMPARSAFALHKSHVPAAGCG
jgi:hypothetical protein